MRITDVVCHVLLQPGFRAAATSSAQDDIVVEVHTDEGVTGIGETDVNPWIARAAIEAPGTHTMGRGLKELLVGEDPLDVERLWEKLYVGSAMNGRRGAVVHAIGALDIALHDLRGKALDKPCYELLGGARRDSIVPYASLQPEVSSFAAYRDSLVSWARLAAESGFTAAKLEATFSGPYRHMGIDEPMERAGEAIAAVREAVGPGFVLMVDVQYAFADADECLRVVRDWEQYDLFFLETPLPADDVEGHARLAREQPIPIAAGEWLSTRFEFLDLMDRALVRVAQPDVGRVGGLTEARRTCEAARERGVTIVPHAWKTGISIAAAAHLAAATANCAYIEFLPAELSAAGLRRDLTSEELALVDGVMPLPAKPGLGIELDRAALEFYRAD
ncbi:MAG: mandelate racemase/muconate lactonizing enzyme family protein [Actinomycetota bacterium]|nr:mandelate racemase/muconate lactonizing enzyme family protein [Actinomycetota bacterium]